MKGGKPNVLFLLILVPVIIGLLSYVIPNRFAKPILILSQFLLCIFSFIVFFSVKENSIYLTNIGGWPDGYSISLLADETSAVMILAVALIYFAFLIYAYHQPYFESQFMFLFLVLEGLLMGLFLSGDLFTIFIFLEVSTVVVSILIMYNKEKQAIYDGMIYFFVNVIGTAFLLFGIGFLYRTFGILDIRAITEMMAFLNDPSAVFIPFALMMTTLSLKTAATPLFSWLPKAHGTPSAPPVVSAVLSGLYIKSGVYLFIRFSEMYAPIINMNHFFFILGALTAIVGFVMAIGQDDIKLLLAYSTVSQIGLIMMGINIGTEIGYIGALYHILNHALFKSTLFLTAGNISEEYGTRNIADIRGLFKRMPGVSWITLFAILGMTGAPLFNGSISKYMIAHGTDLPSVTVLLYVVNMGTITTYIKYSSMFFGKSKQAKKATVDKCSMAGASMLGLGSLLTGLFGVQLSEFLFNYHLLVDTAEYVQKGLIYLLMISAAFLLYRYVIERSKILYKIGHIELTFNGIVTSMVGYFIVLILFLRLFI